MQGVMSALKKNSWVRKMRLRKYGNEVGGDHRRYVCLIISIYNAKICAEVGVWRGETSKQILSNCCIDKLYMVDPYKLEFNHFEHESKLGSPKSMETGCYTCDMGERLLAQAELDSMYDKLLEEIKPWKAKAELLRSASRECCQRIPDKSLDFVFIDAIHLYEYVKEDINAWIPKVKDTGIIAGHDYGGDFPGVIAAVEETFSSDILNVHAASTVWHVNKSDYLRKQMAKGRR